MVVCVRVCARVCLRGALARRGEGRAVIREAEVESASAWRLSHPGKAGPCKCKCSCPPGQEQGTESEETRDSEPQGQRAKGIDGADRNTSHVCNGMVTVQYSKYSVLRTPY